MRRFLVWAAVAAVLLVSGTESYAAKPNERKRDTDPRGRMLAGDLAGDEELAGQKSGGYLRGAETAATLAYTDKASISTNDKTSASYTAKANPPSSVSYGEKTASAPTTAPPTNTPAAGTTTTSPYSSTDAVKQSVGVSSVIVPWSSMTAKGSSYSSTEASTPAPERTEKTGGGLYGAGTKVDNPTASTIAGKTVASYNAKTDPPPSAFYGEKTTASPTTVPPPTASSIERTSTPPYSPADPVKQGGFVSSVVVPWGSVTSNAPSYSSTEGATATERAEYGVGVHDSTNAAPSTDKKSAKTQSDSDARGGLVVDKVSVSKFDMPQGPLTTSATAEKTTASLLPDVTSTSNGLTSTPSSKITSATPYSGDDTENQEVATTTKTPGSPTTDVPTPKNSYDGNTEDGKQKQTTGKSDSVVDNHDSGRLGDWVAWQASTDTSKGSTTAPKSLYNTKSSAQYDHKIASPFGDKAAISDTSGVHGGEASSLPSKFTTPRDEPSTSKASSDSYSSKTSEAATSKPRFPTSGEKGGDVASASAPWEKGTSVAVDHSSSEVAAPTLGDRGHAEGDKYSVGVDEESSGIGTTKHGVDGENTDSRSDIDTIAATSKWLKPYKMDMDGEHGENVEDGYAKSGTRAPETLNSWQSSGYTNTGSHEGIERAPVDSKKTYNPEVAPTYGEEKRSFSGENETPLFKRKQTREEESSSYREKSSYLEGDGEHGGREAAVQVPRRNEAPSSAGYSSNEVPTPTTKKRHEGNENDAEETNSDPAHSSPVYNAVLGRVIPWIDGRPQLVKDTATEKPTPYSDPSEVGAYSDGTENAKSQDYGHPLGDLVPWKETHPLLRRELQSEDVEQPAEQPASEESPSKPELVPADKSADQPEDKTVEQPVDESTEQPVNQPTEKSADQPTEHAEAANDDEMMKTTAVVDENVRWNQDDCDPCDVPTQPPTLAPLYPRNDDDYEQHLPNVTDVYNSWEHVKEEPVQASTKPPKKKAHKPPKADLVRCTKVIGEYGESYECETESTQSPPAESPYESTPSPETPTDPPQDTPTPTPTDPPQDTPTPTYPSQDTPTPTDSPQETPTPTPTDPSQETPAPTTTDPPTEAPYDPTSTPPKTTTPPTTPTPAPTKPTEPTPAPTKPTEPTPAPTKPGGPTPAPTKPYDESNSTPVSTSKGTSIFPSATKATTSKTATPATTSGTSTPSTSTPSVDTSYGTTGGSNDNVVRTSTSDGNTSGGSSGALSGGAIAGIVIACVVFAAVVVGAVLFRQRSIARQREENLFADLAAGGGRALETDYAAM
ncbi:hypothetical protein PR003_g14288 [Phytophthora rubi]|uniref:Uncharacterized protein n=1 Tax=Phytophthora rubi TaxID=129364 RepID=A0A6A4F328_9STRA|nr:hypothetical protein PR003_g14288 [Phytophthora rubi]